MIYPDLSCFSGPARDLLECAKRWERDYPELYWAVTALFKEDAGELFSGPPDYVNRELFEQCRKELKQ